MKTRILFKKEDRETVQKLMQSLSEKDPTFAYAFEKSLSPRYDYMAIISSETKDQAVKRGQLIVHKYLKRVGVIAKYYVKD